MIEVLSTGLLNSVQDGGRPGHLAIGVGRGGAMDRFALDAGLALLGERAWGGGDRGGRTSRSGCGSRPTRRWR